jgi:hypothetical protein
MRDTIASTVVLAGGAWALVNSIRFAIDSGSRYRAEAAWFIFVALLLAIGFTSGRVWATQRPAGPAATLNWAAAAGFIAVSLALYSRLLGLGLLSDDFVLLERARAGRWIDPGWDYVRPVPLALWSTLNAVMPATAVPVGLHALNIVGHGLNGWLLFEVARSFSMAPMWSAAAGLLFLAAPFNIEAVGWASGVFDVTLTAFVLSAVLVTRAATLSRTASLAAISGLTLLAVGTKETAVALPVMLALLVPFAAPNRRSVALAAVAASAAIVGGYVLWRSASGAAGPLLGATSGYSLKELLSRPFGALGYGLHASTLERLPWLGVLMAALWPLALVRSALGWRRDARVFRHLLLAAAWVMASVLPVFTMLYVSPELEGSRYLYLGSTLWAVALVQVLADPGAIGARWAQPGLAVMILAAGLVTLSQQAHWRAAAVERDRVLTALVEAHAACAPGSVENLPDSIRGAYVFRNGFPEAAGAIGLRTNGGDCRLRWNGELFEVTK